MEWLREILTKHGAEKAEEIISDIKAALPGRFIPKSDFDAKSTALETARADIKRLNGEKATLEAAFKTGREDAGIAAKLAGKVHDVNMTASLLDKAKMTFDDVGNPLTGFDEQLAALQKDKAFMFKAAEPPKARGASPAEPPKGEEDKSEAAEMLAFASGLAKEVSSGFSGADPYFSKQ